jgi:hypothetical protein
MEEGLITMSLLGFVLKSMYLEEDRSYLSTSYTMVLPYRLLKHSTGMLAHVDSNL